MHSIKSFRSSQLCCECSLALDSGNPVLQLGILSEIVCRVVLAQRPGQAKYSKIDAEAAHFGWGLSARQNLNDRDTDLLSREIDP